VAAYFHTFVNAWSAGAIAHFMTHLDVFPPVFSGTFAPYRGPSLSYSSPNIREGGDNWVPQGGAGAWRLAQYFEQRVNDRNLLSLTLSASVGEVCIDGEPVHDVDGQTEALKRHLRVRVNGAPLVRTPRHVPLEFGFVSQEFMFAQPSSAPNPGFVETRMNGGRIRNVERYLM
jgi:hypothetical protein